MNLLAETEWKIGDKCYAIFSEDELYYPAIITKVQFLKRLLWSLFQLYGVLSGFDLIIIVADDSDSFVIQIDKGDYHVTFEFYGNEEVKTIDEIEEVEVIEGEDGDENPYNHYERTRHLFDVPEKSKKESSQRKKYGFPILALIYRL